MKKTVTIAIDRRVQDKDEIEAEFPIYTKYDALLDYTDLEVYSMLDHNLRLFQITRTLDHGADIPKFELQQKELSASQGVPECYVAPQPHDLHYGVITRLEFEAVLNEMKEQIETVEKALAE